MKIIHFVAGFTLTRGANGGFPNESKAFFSLVFQLTERGKNANVKIKRDNIMIMSETNVWEFKTKKGLEQKI